MNIPKYELSPYIEIGKRRKLWIILPFVASIIIGIVFIIISDKMYKAKTIILIEDQKISSSYVEPSVRDDMISRMRKIMQKINSRANLNKLIEDYNLIQAEKNSHNELLYKAKNNLSSLFAFVKKSSAENDISRESDFLDHVNNVRDNIDIQFDDEEQTVQIIFQWYDPQVTADVTNALASQFIEQNMKIREEMVIKTTNFLDSEVSRIREELVEKEQVLEEFKRQHMGKLPEQLQSNLNILNQLKDDLGNLESKLEFEKQQYRLIQSQLALTENKNMPQGHSLRDELTQLENELDVLLMRYTENHPDVESLSRRIGKLRLALQSQPERYSAGIQESASFAALSSPELVAIENRISRYQTQINEARAQMRMYKNRIEGTSKVELDLRNLERDYDTVNKRYQDLLAKKLNAQLAEKLEQWQKEEKFQIVDAALPPLTPFRPNILQVMLLAMSLGLGLGGASAYLREVMDPGLYTPEEVESYLDTEVTISLPFEQIRK